ncbi:MAG: hypothetical protein JW938_05090 [Candidatus Omnitrophica bacterium]|nr:hypothetical protein [Candidatus Omnitrophota bacterium]
MDYRGFKKKFGHLPVIETRTVIHMTGESAQTVRNQFHRWSKQGLLEKLRNGYYLLNESERKRAPEPFFIANRLYEPSYVSMETALSMYGFIPEYVAAVTSIATRKTKMFTNSLGTFRYQQVQPGAFRGFREVPLNGMKVWMAEPEKAIVDFLYFHCAEFTNDCVSVLEGSYRFQHLEGVKIGRLREMGAVFRSKKLMRVIEALAAMVRGEKR